jgi:phosphatidate cytidylyltransferase
MMTKELKKRIVTSSVLVLILLCCLFIDNYLWLSLLVSVSLISLYEIINLIKKISKSKFIFSIFSILSFFYFFVFTLSAYKSKIFLNESGILFILSVCILSDIGGYVVGKTVRGKKLTKISPNKTISGSIGSFLFSLFPLIFISEIFITTNFTNIIFCLIISLTCQLGDLFISYLKRLAKVKDTGNFLPGHGGFLDRIDGIIFAVPISFLFWMFVIN